MAVTFTFDSEGDKDVSRVIERLQKELGKMHQQNLKLQEDSKKRQKESNTLISQGTDELRGMAAQLFSVTAVTAAVTTAYKDWRREMEQVGSTHKKLMDDVVKGLGKTGDVLKGGEIEVALSSVPGATRAQGMSAFQGVSGASPALSLQRRLEVSKQVARLAPLGDVERMGSIAGELADILPGETAENITDLTRKMQSMAGGDSGMLNTPGFLRNVQAMQKTGAVGSFEQSAGFLINAAKSELGPRGVESIVEALTADHELAVQERGGKPLTAGQIAKNRFIQAAPEDRLKMLLSDEAVSSEMLGRQGKYARLLDPAQGRAAGRELMGAKADDFASKELAALGGFQAGRDVLAEQGLQAGIDMDPRMRLAGMKEAQKKRLFDQIRAENIDKPWARWNFGILPDVGTGDAMETAEYYANRRPFFSDKPFLSPEGLEQFKAREAGVAAEIEAMAPKAKAGGELPWNADAAAAELKRQTKVLEDIKANQKTGVLPWALNQNVE